MIGYRNSIPKMKAYLLAMVLGAIVLSGALAFIPSAFMQQANAVPTLQHGMGASKINTPNTITAGGTVSSDASTVYGDDFGDAMKIVTAADGVNFSGGAAQLSRSGSTLVPAAGTTMFAMDVAIRAGTNAICTADAGSPTGQTYPCLIGVPGDTYTDGTLTLPGAATLGKLDFNVTVTYPNVGSINDEVRYVWIDQVNAPGSTGGDSNPHDASAGGVVLVTPAQPEISTLINNSSATVQIGIGESVVDTAILSGTVPPGTGTINFYAFDNNSCNGTPVFTDSVAANGNGSYNSTSFTPSSIGTFYLVANFTSDSPNNNNATSGCDDEVLTVIGQASTILTKTGNVTSAILTDSITSVAVKFTYNETNDGDLNLDNVGVVDDSCSPVTYVSGDDGDNLLNPGESWYFECVQTFTTAGSFTNTANATGTVTGTNSQLDGTVINQDSDADEQDSFTVNIDYASTILQKSANVTSGAAPLAVKFTYNETNDGTVDLDNVGVVDDSCSPVTYVSGDDGDNLLNPGESWYFECVQTFTTAGSFTNTANATGTVTGTGTDADGTVINQDNDSDEQAQVTVDITGFEGCTPGFWKTHPGVWGPTGYTPSQTVGSVFTGQTSSLSGDSLLKALSYQGGNNLVGAEKILLRAAVAALLNSAYPGAHYPLTSAQVISLVDSALASDDRATILSLASQLDQYNNLGCFLDAHGNPI